MTHEVLETADSLINGDRNADYGPYSEESAKIARIWSVILETDVKPHHVPLCMIGVKTVRQCNAPKQDNAVDIAGYAALLQDVEDYHGR